MSAPKQPDYATVVCDTMNANLRISPASDATRPTYYPLLASVSGTVKFADGTETTFTINPDSEAMWRQVGHDPDHNIGDQLTEFANLLRKYQQENTPTHHYHVGSNIPGYLPEGDIGCFIEQDDAREGLKAELRRSQEALPECSTCTYEAAGIDPCGQETCVGCTSSTAIDGYLEEIDAATASDVETDGLGFDVSDGRTLPIRFWLIRVDAADCDIDHED